MDLSRKQVLSDIVLNTKSRVAAHRLGQFVKLRNWCLLELAVRQHEAFEKCEAFF